MSRKAALAWSAGVVAILALVGWRDREMHRHLERLANAIDRIRSDTVRWGPRAEDFPAIQRTLEQQAKLLETIAACESAKTPPSLAQLRAAKPEVDASAVEAALKDTDSAGRVASITFLTPGEVLARFGAPSVTLARDGTVTWIYKLEGFEKLLRLEFVDGVVLTAYDR